MSVARTVRAGQRVAGAVLLCAAVWKLWQWGSVVESMRFIAASYREGFTAVLLTIEGTVGVYVLSSSSPKGRARCLIALSCSLLAGRLVVDPSATCECFGPALPGWLAEALLISFAALGVLGAWVVDANSVWVRVVPVVLLGAAVGTTTGTLVKDKPDWLLAGSVGRDPGRNAVTLMRADGLPSEGIVSRAESSCHCLTAVPAGGPALVIEVHERVPDTVLPLLRVWIDGAARPIEVEVPIRDSG